MSPIAIADAPVALAHPVVKPVAAASTPPAQLHHTTPQPVALSGAGMTFTLDNGQTILDAVSGGAAVACLGNGNAEVVAAMTAQAERMAYTYHQLLGSQPGEELAQWLVDQSNGTLAAAAFLNSGSEAMEAAIKLVRQYWVEKGEPSRKYIIARSPSYHGNTLGALGVGYVKGRREIYEPFIPDTFVHVSAASYKRDHLEGETEEAYSARLAAELDAKITSLGPENVAAFVAEPVVGAALGVMPPPRGYFPAIAAVVQKHNLLLVMDEVMSGTGRVGHLFAHAAVAEGVTPDIMAMAKGLGAGYVTISGVMVNARVAAEVRQAGQWKNSHTYQNHPVNCAVALTVLRIMERENLWANVVARGEQLRAELRAATADMPVVYDFVGVEFDTAATLAPRFAMRVRARAFEHGLLTLALTGTIDGVAGDSITLAPAYVVTAEQITEIVRIMAQSIKECAAEL